MRIAIAILAAASLLFFAAAQAAAATYLTLDGIDGEPERAKADKHEYEVLSWSWGAGVYPKAPGVVIVTLIPGKDGVGALYRNRVKIGAVRLRASQASGSQLDIQLEHCKITSFSTSSAGDVAVETVKISYEAIVRR